MDNKFKGAKRALVTNLHNPASEDDIHLIGNYGLENKLIRCIGEVRLGLFTECICLLEEPNKSKFLEWIERHHEKVHSFIDVPYGMWRDEDDISDFTEPYSVLVLRKEYVKYVESNKEAKFALDTL